MHRLTLKLDNATERKFFPYSGSYIAVRGATDTTTTVTIFFKQEEENGFDLDTDRLGFRGMRFSGFWLSWSAQAGKTIELFISEAGGPELVEAE